MLETLRCTLSSLLFLAKGAGSVANLPVDFFQKPVLYLPVISCGLNLNLVTIFLKLIFNHSIIGFVIASSPFDL